MAGRYGSDFLLLYFIMDFTSTRLPYRQTGAFKKIALDYIDRTESLKPFFAHPPTLQGIQKAIAARKQFGTNREVLVQELKKQYADLPPSEPVQNNIQSLLSENTFTITTAHQNNIFTGPLYFIYKILHVIKLADHLNTSLPGNHFIPVFYMGTEDADLDELNHIYLNDEKLVWNTKQTGAVGRMKINNDFLKLISSIEGQLSVLPFGKEILTLVKECYKPGDEILAATLKMVNALFAEYGLIVLLPDNGALKKQMGAVFQDDLLHQTASGIVEKTAGQLDTTGYKVQVNPREINLFYLKDDLRERIVRQGTKYKAQGTSLDLTEEELLKELQEHPERFSPNVILRGLYQETILPNIVFIGGGGETAYWLQLKDLFEHYTVPFPVLVLRNSFLVVEKKWQSIMSNLGYTADDFFLPEQELLTRLVARETDQQLKLNGTLLQTEKLYDDIKKQAAAIDITLGKHVDFLKLKTLQRLLELEKKMLRAEKRKFADQQRQIHTLKEKLFPGNGLQERYDNMLYYYAKWGKDFIQRLYLHSLNLEQEFVTLVEQ